VEVRENVTPQEFVDGYDSGKGVQGVFVGGPRLGKHHTNTSMQNLNFFWIEQANFLENLQMSVICEV